MPTAQATKDFITYLRKNPLIRLKIAAAPGKTLLYSGNFFKPVWKELADLKRTNPQVGDKEMLPDVLSRILLPGQRYPSLLDWAKDLDHLQPWSANGFRVWRALSGIFAANAKGTVSFYIGSWKMSGEKKVFAATELGVIARNPQVDAVTKDMVAYYKRCVEAKQAALDGEWVSINTGFISR
jgi:hypothetical protein